MPVAFEFEDDGQLLRFEFTGLLTMNDIDASFAYMKDALPKGLEKILVLRNEERSDISIEEGLSHGGQLGDLLAGHKIAYAVVRKSDHKDGFFMDHGLSMQDVTLCEFETEDDARRWLEEQS